METASSRTDYINLVRRISGIELGAVGADEDIIKFVCSKLPPSLTYSVLDNIMLVLPVLKILFPSNDFQKNDLFGQHGEWKEYFSVMCFTPRDDFTEMKPNLMIGEPGDYSLEGHLRTVRTKSKYKLCLAKIESNVRWVVISYDHGFDSKDKSTDNHPCIEWINLQSEAVTIEYVSEDDFDESSEQWLSILQPYYANQAVASLEYAKQEIDDVRGAIQELSQNGIDFVNSQLVSTTDLTSVELNVKIIDVFLQDVLVGTGKESFSDALVAVHSSNTVLNQVMHVSLKIRSLIGIPSRKIPSDEADVFAGGRLMNGALVYEHVIDRF